MSAEDHVSARTFDMDFVYCDLLFHLIYLACLCKACYYAKNWRPVLYSLCISYPVYFIVDCVVWYYWKGLRHIEGPANPLLLQIWLQFGPSLLHNSWLIIMLETVVCPVKGRKKGFNPLLWTFAYFIVQFTPGFLSLAVEWDDAQQMIWREMSNTRWGFWLGCFIGYSYLTWREIPNKTIFQMMLIAFFAEGMFELSLLLSGIRPWDENSLEVLLFDALIEYNVGMPATFCFWRWTYKREERPMYSSYFPIQAIKDTLNGEFKSAEERALLCGDGGASEMAEVQVEKGEESA